jgi:HSP20 family molecular chaperone IbpA
MSALREAMRELPDAVFADLLESDDAYLLVVDMPGVVEDTVDVAVTDGTLELEARREKDVPVSFSYLREDRSLFLDAELPLPPDATGAGASATIDRGVLELRLPKRDAAPEREIPIESR